MTAQPDLQTFLNRINFGELKPQDFQRELFDFQHAAIRSGDEELADIMLACAIPICFTKEIVATLLDQPVDSARTEYVFDVLVDLPFVSPRLDGKGYVYHEAERKIALNLMKIEPFVQAANVNHKRLADYFTLRRDAAMDLQQYDDALEETNELIDIGINPDAHRLIRANILTILGDYKSAIEDLNVLSRQFDREPRLYYLLGRNYYHLGQPDKALPNYDLAIRMKADRAEYRYWRALANIALKNDAAAVGDLERAINLDVANPDGYYLLAWVLMNNGEFDRAQKEISQAIQLQPSSSLYYYIRGLIYTLRGNHEPALADARKAIQLEPKSVQNLLLLRRIYRNLGDQPAALEVTQEAIQLFPDVAELYHARARILLDLKSFSEAQADLDRAVELDPKEASIYHTRASLYYRQHRLEEALAELNKAVELAPDRVDYLESRRRVFRDLDRQQEALKDSYDIIRLAPDSGEGYFSRGRVYSSLKNWPSALHDFLTAEKLGVQQGAGLQSHIANVYLELGLFDDAIEHLNRAIELDPKNSDFFYQRSLVCLSARRKGPALSDISRAIEINPNRVDYYLMRRRMWRDIGNQEAALEDNTSAIELAPNTPDLYEMRARIYTTLGNLTAAEKDQKKAFTLSAHVAKAH